MAARKSEAGFTLVEFMIATITLALLMGSLLAVVQVSESLHNTTQQGLELQQNVRSSLNFIARELINAGSGVPYITRINGSPPIQVPAGAMVGHLGAPIAGNAVFFVTPGDAAGETVATDGAGTTLATTFQTDMLTFLGGMGDARFVDQNPPGPTANWGGVVYVEDATIFSPGMVVLITNGFQIALGQITGIQGTGLQFNSGLDPLGLNASGTAENPTPGYSAAQQIPGGPPPQVMPLSAITYFVDATTDPAHPALKRSANNAVGAPAALTLADDIEDFQVEWVVDHDANATTASVPIDGPIAAQLSLVRGVTVTIRGRSRVRMDMDNATFTDRHARLTMSQTVFFRNNIRR
jgi:hypothetical protein